MNKMKNIISTLAGITWVFVTVHPTIFIGVAVVMTLWALDLIIN